MPAAASLKRAAPTSTAKGKARAAPPAPAKRVKLAASASKPIKRSNRRVRPRTALEGPADPLLVPCRPGLDASGSSSRSEASADEHDDDPADERAAMLAALAAHQASFLSEALPMASTSALGGEPARAVQAAKSVWEMDDADFEEGEESEESEESEDEDEGLEEAVELREEILGTKQRASFLAFPAAAAAAS